MDKLDHRKFFLDLQFSRRALMRRAGGVVAAIALSSCIGAGVAYADDDVVTSVEQEQTALVQDSQPAAEAISSEEDNVAALSDDADSSLDSESDQAEDSAEVDDTTNDDSVDEAAEAEASQENDQDAALVESDVQEQKAAVSVSATSSSATEKVSDSNPYVAPDDQQYSAFDLRHYGGDVSYSTGDAQSTITGGTDYVTSVKLQNPFGSCWAFSVTAASETSLLTELDKADDGLMNGTISYEIAAAWLKADMADDGALNASATSAYGKVASRIALLAEYASDLSERHLAYFSFYQVTEDSIYPEQAGEGKFLVNTDDLSKIFDTGGMPWLGLSEYSSGLGPVPEFVAPYMNEEGIYDVRKLVIKDDGTYSYETVTYNSFDEASAYVKKTWTDDVIAKYNKDNGENTTAGTYTPRKSAKGTWSVDESLALQVFAELTNSNVLDLDLSNQGLSSQEIDLMKNELLEGHAISIAFDSDQSRPGQTLAGNTYLNTDTWAHYTYNTERFNHGVTIVGYDDNYAASNFTHNIYKTDASGQILYDDEGNPVVDEELTALTTPAGNGAWIVKNSWGCTTPDDPSEYLDWGIDGTGYFYLSYYDKSISHMESFEFDVSEEALERLGYVAYQHDLASISSYMDKTTSSVSKMCNVFDGPEQGDGPVSIRDLGFVTAAPDDTVTLEVYVMDDSEDVQSVIDKGNPVVVTSATFDCSGFHRIHLDSAIKVSPDQKFAVVQTTKRADGSYEYVYLYAMSEELASAFNEALEPLGDFAVMFQLGSYTSTVINKGESLLMTDGGWQDLIEAAALCNQESIPDQMKEMANFASQFRDMGEKSIAQGREEEGRLFLQVAENFENIVLTRAIAIDNWCIKAYADAIGIDISKALVQVTDEVYDGNVHKAHVTVTYGGMVLIEGVDYVLSGSLEEIEVGVYDFVVYGIGDYIGEIASSWKVIPASVPDTPVVPGEETFAYQASCMNQASCGEDGASTPKTGDAMATTTMAAATGLLGVLAALASASLLRLRRRKS